MRRVRILQPLRHRDYRLLAVGSLVSLLGDGIFIASIALQVYALRDTPTAMSIVGLIVAGSTVALLLVGGVVSDRFDRRAVMIWADVARAAAMGGIGVLSLTGALEFWHILVLIGVHGAANAFFNPASMAFVPDVVPEGDLPQANAFMGAARPMMRLLFGPAVGGVIVAAWSPGGSFVVNAGTFLFSAAMLALLRTRSSGEPAGGAGVDLSGLGEGIRWVRAHPWCWAWLLGASLSILAFHGPFDVLLPFLLLTDQTLGLSQTQAEVQYGLILAGGGLGSVLVSLVVGQLDLPRRFVTTMYLAEAAGVGLLVVFGLMSAVWQALVASFVIYGMYAYTEIAWTTLVQRKVPRRMLGRVSSLDWLTSLGLVPLSFAVAGPLAETFTPRAVLVGGGIAGAAVLLGLLLVPGVREPEREIIAEAGVPQAAAADRH